MRAKKTKQRGMSKAGMLAMAGVLAGPLATGGLMSGAAALGIAATVMSVSSAAQAQPTTGTIWTGTIGTGLNQSQIAVMVDGPAAGKISVQRLAVNDAVLRDVNFERDRMRFRLTRPARGIEWSFDLRVNPDGNTARGTLREGANAPTQIELRRWDGKGQVPTVTSKTEEPMSTPPAIPLTPAPTMPAAAPVTPVTPVTPGAPVAPATTPTTNNVLPSQLAAPGGTTTGGTTPAAQSPTGQTAADVAGVIPPAVVEPAPVSQPAAAPTPGATNSTARDAGGVRRLSTVIPAAPGSGGTRGAGASSSAESGQGGASGTSQITAPLPPRQSLPAGQGTPEARPSGGLTPLTPAGTATGRPGANVPQAPSEPGPAVAPPLNLIAAANEGAGGDVKAQTQAVPKPVPVAEPTPSPAAVPVQERAAVPAPAPAAVSEPAPVQAPVAAPVATPIAPATSPAGAMSQRVWEGRVTFSPSRTARITVTVDEKNQARVSIPEMAMFDLPATDASGSRVLAASDGGSVILDGSDLRFEIPGLPASAAARLRLAKSAANHGRYDGTLTHLNAEFAVRLAPSAAESTRAQTPRPPLPYITRQMLVTATDGAKLPGTLTLPNREVFGPGPHPAVVLLSGSGVQDRDQTIFGHKTLAVLADALARAGVASLRCDDRGYLGHYNPAGNQVTSLSLAADALVIHAALRGEIGIDSTRVGIMGHSEGGLLAAMAASESADVAFIAMLAAPTQIGRDVISRQVSTVRLAGQPADDAMKASLKAAFENIVAKMDDDQSLRQAVEELVRLQVRANNIPINERTAEWTALVEKGAKEFQQPWLRTYVKLDPAVYLTKVRVPTLAVFGDLDMQVNSEANARRLRGVFAGSVPLKIEELAGLNHLLQTATTGEVSEYATIEETMSPRAINAIVRWTASITGARPLDGTRGGDERVSRSR